MVLAHDRIIEPHSFRVAERGRLHGSRQNLQSSRCLALLPRPGDTAWMFPVLVMVARLSSFNEGCAEFFRKAIAIYETWVHTGVLNTMANLEFLGDDVPPALD